MIMPRRCIIKEVLSIEEHLYVSLFEAFSIVNKISKPTPKIYIQMYCKLTKETETHFMKGKKTQR